MAALHALLGDAFHFCIMYVYLYSGDSNNFLGGQYIVKGL